MGVEIKYHSGDSTLHGYYVAPQSHGPAPCVLVVHEWWGCNDYVKRRADMLAEEGYAAMAIDLYGDGKTASNASEAGELMGTLLSQENAVLERFKAALDVVKSQVEVDPNKIAGIGYCLGGAVVLNMARAGLDLNLVASFHGNLSTPSPAQPGTVRAQVAVFHGNDDVMIPEEQVTAFKKEMDDAGVDYHFVGYEGAMHGFTNPLATERGQKSGLPLAYNEEADIDSWNQLLKLLSLI